MPSKTPPQHGERADALAANSHPEADLQNAQSKKIVYIDQNSKAHWAYEVSFFAQKAGLPEKPIYILDIILHVKDNKALFEKKL